MKLVSNYLSLTIKDLIVIVSFSDKVKYTNKSVNKLNLYRISIKINSKEIKWVNLSTF